MERLGQVHIDFLRKCAADSGHTHKPEGIKKDELELMVSEGLLIAYNRGSYFEYAITQNGGKVAATFGDSPELVKIAVEYVMSKGYSDEAAEKIVKDYGAEHILKSKAAEDKGDGEGQREVKAPADFGLNIKKSF